MEGKCELCGEAGGKARVTLDFPLPNINRPQVFVAIGFRVPGRASGDQPVLCNGCCATALTSVAESLVKK